MNPLRILRAATLALIAGARACTLGPNFEAPASTVPPVFARTQTLQAPASPSRPPSTPTGGPCSTTPC